MPTPLAELVAPIKKGSLGGAQVADVGKICDSELKASDDDPSEGDNNGTETDHSKFVYHRDRVVDKYSVTRDTINEGTAATLSYNNSDQKSTSPNLYVETNAKAEADVVVLPTQAVSNSNEDEGDYAYLEPSVNYGSDGKEKCSRTTNNLFKPSELVAMHGKASTTLDSPFQATRAKGEYQGETILHANDYKTGPSPNGMTVELNDGFCFIASINEAAEYGTLLLNFQQYHPVEGGITSYMINNHIQDPNGLLVAPRTFKEANSATAEQNTEGYYDGDSINYQSMYKAKLSPVSLYSAPMWVYNKMVESRVVSYPHGHNDLKNNSDLQAYIAYIQSYSKNDGDKSADLNVSISSTFLATPFTNGISIRTVVPFGENVTQSTASADGRDRTNEHGITAYGADSALHAGFSNSSYSNQVLWNADSVDGVTGQNTSDRKSVVGPTVSNVIRADLGWRPYEIIVFRGTLTYNKSTGVESHSEDYVEYFRFRTFDKVFEQGTYDRANNSYSKDAESTGTLNEDEDIHAYSFPVTGYHRESDGNFVINFSENFNTSNFSEQNKLKVAVIQDIVVDSSAVQATFTSDVINSILPSENRVFSPVYEDTLQVLSNDETLFSDINRPFAGHPSVRPFGFGVERFNGEYDHISGNTYASYWYFDPPSSTSIDDLYFAPLWTDDWYDHFYVDDDPENDVDPYGTSPCFNANQFIRAYKGGPSANQPGTLAITAWDSSVYDTVVQGDEFSVGGVDLSALPDQYYSTVPHYGDWPANRDIPAGTAVYTAAVNISPDGGTTLYPTDSTQRYCYIPIFPDQNIKQMDAEGVNQEKTAEDWGYAFSDGLAVRRNTLATYGDKNDTVFTDPACAAGYVNGYRESSWFARDLVAAYSATFFNQYKNNDFGVFHAEHNGVPLVMPPPWTLGIQLIKPENINGIALGSVRCSPDRDTFHSEGLDDTLNGVGYHCGECEDLAEPPSAEFDDATKHGKVKKGFPLTDTLNDHRSYVRIHDGANLNP